MLRKVLFVTLLINLFVSVLCQHAAQPAVKLTEHDDYADTLKKWADLIGQMREDQRKTPLRPSGQQTKSSNDPTDIKFDCPPLAPSATPPKSVHELRPADIGIVAALGDSITAGNGVRAPMDMRWTTFLGANRGESFSVGGERSLDEGVITITNILRKYNKDVKGASYCARNRAHGYSGYNVAIPGATSRGIEGQARDLINKLLAGPMEEYWESWKLVTLLIGGNDLCQHCEPGNEIDFSPDGYVAGIKRGLDLLHEYLPKAFVNVVIMSDVSVVKDFNHPEFDDLFFNCDRLHNFECPCHEAMFIKFYQQQYYYKLVELLADGKYDTRDDFTVVIQPFMRDQEPFKLEDGSYDMSFIAPDCFHPGVKMHQAFAILLWNSMFTPESDKFYKIEEGAEVKYTCPTEEAPFLYTRLNSN